MQQGTRVLFLNHASVLISHEGQFVLTDPWYQSPAFGSWLPVPPMVINPSYLMALKDRLRIVISHGHDDHCDDKLLRLFSDREIFIANFDSPGVKKRIEKLGFTKINQVTESGVRSGPFTIKSYIDAATALDDAIFTIETDDALVVHAQDNWRTLSEEVAAAIGKDVKAKGGDRCIYMSQTNSASGYPMNYFELSDEEKQSLLFKKVFDMTSTGLANAAHLEIKNFLSYAGYAGVFIREHPEYFDKAFFPSRSFILDRMREAIPSTLKVLDMLPGDSFNFKDVQKSTFGPFIDDAGIKDASRRFYQHYGVVDDCASYKPQIEPIAAERFDSDMRYFLQQFNEFVSRKAPASGFLPTIMGKSMLFEVTDLGLSYRLTFGKGLDGNGEYNKHLKVKSGVMDGILRGESLFENLCTGYAGEFARRPKDVYNRDIVLYMVMYSYVYKERLAPARFSKATTA